MAVLGWSTRASSAYDSSRMYDLCHRFTLLTEGLGRHRLFPLSVRLLGGLFTPSLQRIPTPPNERSFAIIVGTMATARLQWSSFRASELRPNALLMRSCKRPFGTTLATPGPRSRCSGARALIRSMPGSYRSCESVSLVTRKGLTSSFPGQGTMCMASGDTKLSLGITNSPIPLGQGDSGDGTQSFRMAH